MRTLQVIGVEEDRLIVVSDSGERFIIPVDEALHNALRKPSMSRPAQASKVSPREIQAHIRRGLSSQQVADLTGETLDYVTLFEGPVVAEREYIAQQAQAIQIEHPLGDRDRHVSFGESVRQRLGDLGAHDATWSAWKEETGWRVEVRFTENTVEHQAMWSFEPRKQLLVPLNDDATTLSQPEPIQGPLIPRLRPVVATDDSPAGERFDSEIFDNMPLSDTGPLLEPVAYGKTSALSGQPTPHDSDDADSPASNETADLLEALRRRRGEREPAPEGEDLSRSNHPSTGSIRLVPDEDAEPEVHASEKTASIHFFPGTGEVPREEPAHNVSASPEGSEEGPDAEAPQKPRPKRGRPNMPSWDDIVFGTKPGDDPA
ncbi:DUF3071-like protein [Pontimonas salivibrio]|uniref:DUF3071-like protein n=1 Tax=Pontimonas salivibrio TaxID=1159327 RepID=A0A2L2BQG6_9MICO|nr:septation protein SepH [Pontimonas salivibrio]AVG23906.1 DUF3071-like protein [Pontimonas salivibrio]